MQLNYKIVVTGGSGRFGTNLKKNYKSNKLFYPKSSYDIMVVDSNGNRIKLLEGFLTLSRSVTI